jgi:hypothetical protein
MGLKPSGRNKELWAKNLHETILIRNYGLKASGAGQKQPGADRSCQEQARSRQPKSRPGEAWNSQEQARSRNLGHLAPESGPLLIKTLLGNQ